MAPASSVGGQLLSGEGEQGSDAFPGTRGSFLAMSASLSRVEGVCLISACCGVNLFSCEAEDDGVVDRC